MILSSPPSISAKRVITGPTRIPARRMPGRLEVEPGLDVLIAGDVGDHTDDEKSAEIHDEVNHDIKKNRREPVIVEHREAHHHVTRMGDA